MNVSFIGFLATWWVGFFIGWFLSRYQIKKQSAEAASKNIKYCFVIVFLITILFTLFVGMYCAVMPNFYSYRYLGGTLAYYGIINCNAFMSVVFIHYASYFGGFLGFIVSLLVLWRKNNMQVARMARRYTKGKNK